MINIRVHKIRPVRARLTGLLSTRKAIAIVTVALLAVSILFAGLTFLVPHQNAPLKSSTVGWSFVGENQQNTWYSPQTEINSSSVGQLTLSWFAPLNTTAGTPVVVNGIVYVAGGGSAPLPASIEAINETTGSTVWIDGPNSQPSLNFSTNGGVTLASGTIFATTFEGRLLSLNATDGHLKWETSMIQGIIGSNFPAYEEPQATPFVYKDEVIVAETGGDNGSRGFLRSFNVTDGELLWTFYTVPPDPITTMNQAFYKKTWGECANCSGGDVWSVPALDPRTGIIYFGTGNPYPSFDPSKRSPSLNDTNLYTDSIIALNATSGKMLWDYQAVAADVHDWDVGTPVQLFNTTIKGQTIEVVGAGGKNGYYYVLDAAKGTLLYKVKVGIHQNENSPAIAEGSVVYPGSFGGINTYSSYNPETSMIYTMAYNKPNNYSLTDSGIQFKNVNSADANSTLYAINASDGRIVWTMNLLGWGGGVSSSNTLVFTSSGNGTFYSLDAWTGRVLWNYTYEVLNQYDLWQWGPPSLSDGKVFATVFGPNGGVLCFSIQKQSQRASQSSLVTTTLMMIESIRFMCRPFLIDLIR